MSVLDARDKDWRDVTEYVSTRGAMVVWSVVDRTTPDQPIYSQAVAVRSPLTGMWLVMSWAEESRYGSLQGARAAMFGGNGHRHRGHSEIDHVVYGAPWDHSARLRRLLLV